MPSKAQQAHDHLRDCIHTGQLRPGQRLDSDRELARRLGLNHQTIRRALADLVEEGLVVKRPRVGTFVCDHNDLTSVAVVLPAWLSNDASRQTTVGLVLAGLHQALPSRHFSLTVLFYRPEHFWEDIGQAVISRGIRGVVLWAHYCVPAGQIEQLMAQGVRVVGLTRHHHLSGLDMSSFAVDGPGVLAEILTGLLERGHRRLVVVRFRRPSSPAHVAVVAEFAERAQLGDPREMTLWLPNEVTVDYEPLEELFSRQPTAVVVPDECVASEVFRRCYQRGLRIPQDMSLAAMGDVAPGALPVPLTAPDSVHWIVQTARQAGEHLRALLEGVDLPAATVRLNAPVQWKASVQPASSAALVS